MTNRFDPTRLDGHLRHSARLRSRAFFKAVGRLGNGVKRVVRAVALIWV